MAALCLVDADSGNAACGKTPRFHILFRHDRAHPSTIAGVSQTG
jgi:hypothetical protein